MKIQNATQGYDIGLTSVSTKLHCLQKYSSFLSSLFSLGYSKQLHSSQKRMDIVNLIRPNSQLFFLLPLRYEKVKDENCGESKHDADDDYPNVVLRIMK